MRAIRTCLPMLALCVSIAASEAPAAFDAALSSPPDDVAIEYYHATFDHYFITRIPEEIDALDAGRFTGWTRSGRGFAVVRSGTAVSLPGLNPVCRFYIPPQHGDSHFFSASTVECNDILNRIGVDPNYSGYVYESGDIFRMVLPDIATGACPAPTVPVYRLWNERADSNHRYTTDPGIKAAMLAKGYRAEGYGNDGVALCSTAAVLVDALTRASGLSPFAAGCEGVVSGGAPSIGSEVEPFLAINPANPKNMIGVWQQDRWSNGGARGTAGAFSMDGGGTWTRTAAAFSRCSGGTAANGGNFERATDPWVSFGPDGTAYQVALAFNNITNADNVIAAARSTDGGRTWSNPATLRRDGAAAFNDKEAITADPTDARYVYVTWDRLSGTSGPTWFARTTDGGASWETAREIYNPHPNGQTINNIVVVLPDGTLVLSFTEPSHPGNATTRVRIIRSSDKGATWSAPITVATHQGVGTLDPETGNPIRDGSILGAVAAGKDGSLAIVWQDARFSGGAFDGVAFARSIDGGLTWSAPVRVNDAPGTPAFLPNVVIRDDGIIGVTYHDFRSNTPDPNTLPTDTWLSTSADGGRTWSEQTIAAPFDFAMAPLARGALFLGDYTGMAATGTSFVAFNARTTGSNTNRSDVFAALRPNVVVGTSVAKAAHFAAAAAAELPMTPALAARLDVNVRRALAQRLPERRLDNLRFTR
ncbi:MAG: sialidase family protein [Casimicrobiaceae bacterium]